MSDYDEALRLRIEDLADADERSRRAPSRPGGAAALLAATTTITTYPTTAARFYACHPLTVTGAESEGSTGSFAADTSTTLYALNLGSSIPPSGTNVLVTFAAYRWVFRFDA